MLQRIDERLVVEHRFIVSLFLLFDLLKEELFLDEWVVQLGVGIAKLVVVDEQLEPFA